MRRSRVVGAIDIGNSLVKAVIAEINRETLNPKILSVGTAISHGLRRGVVIDMETTIRDVAEAVKKAETMAGVKMRRAYVAVNGLHIKTQLSHGVIAVSRADNEIAQGDIDRVIDAASIVSLPANREIIHILPKYYLVDGQEYVKNPLGMKGVRLEAEVFIIDGLSPYLKNLAKCLNAADIEAAEFVFSPLAARLAVFNKDQVEHGVINLDLGGGVSTISFFHEGELMHAATIPVGSRHLTNDLAVALRTSMDAAEEIKLRYGFAGLTSSFGRHAASKKEEMARKDELDLSDLVGEEDFIIPRKNIARVIEARLLEICELLQGEIKKLSSVSMIPAGVVLTGGGAKLPGLANFVKERIKLPVRVGVRPGLAGYADLPGPAASLNDLYDPSLAVALGLAFYGLEKEFSKNKGDLGISLAPSSQLFRGFLSKLKDFLP